MLTLSHMISYINIQFNIQKFKKWGGKLPRKTININQEQGSRLSKARKHRNITQEKLAELSNYSVQTISGIENGTRRLTLESANIFAKALMIRVEYLTGEDNYMSYSDLYGQMQNKCYKESDALETLINSFGYDYKWIDTEIETNEKEHPVEIQLTSLNGERIIRLIDFELAKKEMLEFIEFKLQKLMREGESNETS